ncbi:MAG: hypothetical protein ACRYF5_08105, partial [Janthinobacterium lividum]
MPAITNTVTIDGTTAPGYAGTPLISIDGNHLNGAGLTFSAGSAGSVVVGLSITNFGSAGISLETGANATIIQGNYIGLDTDGLTGQGNNDGILIASDDNLIGGTTAAQRNVITASAYNGIYIYNGSNNVIEGNYLGTDASGTVAVGNGDNGVSLNGAVNTTIGNGSVAGRNLISGNLRNGIYTMNIDGLTIMGNYVGTTVSG